MPHTKQLIDTVGKECKGEEMDACIMCSLTATDDEETEISMEFSKCMHCVHKSCLSNAQNVLSLSNIIIIKC